MSIKIKSNGCCSAASTPDLAVLGGDDRCSGTTKDKPNEFPIGVAVFDQENPYTLQLDRRLGGTILVMQRK